MIRTIVGTILGLVIGGIVNYGIVLISWTIYPVPDHIDQSSADPEQQKLLMAWISTLPTGAFIWAWVAHWVGAAVGTLVGSCAAGRRSYAPAVVIGLLFTAGGVYMVTLIDGPAWFPWIDIPSYLIASLAIAKLVMKKPEAT